MKQKDECRLWLESYRELRTEYRRLQNRHMKLLSEATKITSRWSDMPGGGERDHEKLLAALADSDDETCRAYLKVESRMREIEEFIDALPTPTFRIILRLRYIELYSWLQIERVLPKDMIFYSLDHIYRLHGRALKEARAAFEKRKETNHA